MLAAWNQTQPPVAKRLAAKDLLFPVVTLALTFGIYLPTHYPRAKNQKSSRPSHSLCSQRISVIVVRDRPMGSSCHRTAEERGSPEDSRWASQTRGLSLEGQVGICQDEKGKEIQQKE